MKALFVAVLSLIVASLSATLLFTALLSALAHLA